MCVKYAFKKSFAEIADLFAGLDLPLSAPAGAPNLEPRDEITLTERAPVVRPADEGAALHMDTWSWKGPGGRPVFNFRSEGRRFAAPDRRLILTDGFYEFLDRPDGAPKSSRKPRVFFTRPGRALFAIAGYARASDPEHFTMLTCDPGPDIAPWHARQPVVLPTPADWRAWLTGAAEPALLRPSEAGTLEAETPREGAAARLRDEVKRLKMLDLEFANDVMTAPGEAVDREAPKRERKQARAEAAEQFRKGRL